MRPGNSKRNCLNNFMGLGMLKKKLAFVFIAVFCCVVCFSTIARAVCPLADFSGDCVVDMADLIILADDWLSSDLPVHPDLVSRWRLDEPVDSETAFDDISGNTGQLYGDPQWMPSGGYWQGALFFDGIADYVEIADNSGLNPGSNGWSVAFWFCGK